MLFLPLWIQLILPFLPYKNKKAEMEEARRDEEVSEESEFLDDDYVDEDDLYDYRPDREEKPLTCPKNQLVLPKPIRSLRKFS